MMIKVKELFELLPDARLNRNKDHIVSDCPFCGKEGHFFVNIVKITQKVEGVYRNAWDCKKCPEKGNLNKLLKKLGREDLLAGESLNLVKVEVRLKGAPQSHHSDEIIQLPNKKLPLGFKRLMGDDYLESRGFSERHFQLYPVGRTDMLFKFKDYLIFSVEDEGMCKGYLSRSMLSKEAIKELNKSYKEQGLKKKYLRWINSHSDFSKLLYGIDELGFETETAILVEGLFDKVSVDNTFNLLFQQEIKCLSTFGKSISDDQIYRLKKKGIKNVIVVQDPDAVEESKERSMYLQQFFESVLVGFTGDKDLGDSNCEEVQGIFSRLQSPFEFNIGKVLKRQLV